MVALVADNPLVRLINGGVSGQMLTRRFDDQTDVLYTYNAGSEDPIDSASYNLMWSKQPHLRTVIDFLARNVAQIGMHAYTTRGGAAERLHGDMLSQILNRPNHTMTQYDLLYSLVGDYALYQRAFWLVVPDLTMDTGWRIQPIPPVWVTVQYSNAFDPPKYHVSAPDDQSPVVFTSDEIIEFKGWVPGDTMSVSSPAETLRLTLEEQHHARVYRKQVWRNSGRFGLVFTRPNDAPKWDNNGRRRFMEMVREFVGDRGARAGDGPILEDGMDAKRLGFSSADEEWAESTKLSLATCAQVYHVNPTMVGLLDNANFANVREFRRSLYGDTLGPYIRMIEQRLNQFLLPRLGVPDTQYLEFNVESKLRGSFEEQAGVVSTATGAPWQTRNEARRLFNLPDVEGGDELITPLNVLVGNQASPQDGQTERSTNPPVSETEDEAGNEPKSVSVSDEALVVWAKTRERQQRAVLPKIRAGVEPWWNADRWDRELAQDLAKAGVQVQDDLVIRMNEITRDELAEQAGLPASGVVAR